MQTGSSIFVITAAKKLTIKKPTDKGSWLNFRNSAASFSEVLSYRQQRDQQCTIHTWDVIDNVMRFFRVSHYKTWIEDCLRGTTTTTSTATSTTTTTTTASSSTTTTVDSTTPSSAHSAALSTALLVVTTTSARLAF